MTHQQTYWQDADLSLTGRSTDIARARSALRIDRATVIPAAQGGTSRSYLATRAQPTSSFDDVEKYWRIWRRRKAGMAGAPRSSIAST